MIPVIRVEGSHREVGRRLGEAAGGAIRRAVERAPHDRLALAAPYREVTEAELPWVVEELDAVAEAAGVDPLALFAASVEELRVEAPVGVGCTDVVVGPPLTASGDILVGHTNDLAARQEDDLVAIEWRVHGQPAAFSLGVGPWLSVGWNEHGLSVTGNELSPNDERIGVPRLLQMRDVLTRTSIAEAARAALHPRRASSYNWVLASPEGAVNIEGSATDAVVRELADEPVVHANHYAEPAMRRYEGDVSYAERSSLRHTRCRVLVDAASPASLTPASMRELLSDHEGAPDSLCRHATGPDEVKTVFWCAADLAAREVIYGRGNPCAAEHEERHAFA